MDGVALAQDEMIPGSVPALDLEEVKEQGRHEFCNGHGTPKVDQLSPG